MTLSSAGGLFEKHNFGAMRHSAPPPPGDPQFVHTIKTRRQSRRVTHYPYRRIQTGAIRLFCQLAAYFTARIRREV